MFMFNFFTGPLCGCKIRETPALSGVEARCQGETRAANIAWGDWSTSEWRCHAARDCWSGRWWWWGITPQGNPCWSSSLKEKRARDSARHSSFMRWSQQSYRRKPWDCGYVMMISMTNWRDRYISVHFRFFSCDFLRCGPSRYWQKYQVYLIASRLMKIGPWCEVLHHFIEVFWRSYYMLCSLGCT